MPGEQSDPGGGTAVLSAQPADLQRSVEEMTQMVRDLREAQSAIRRRTILGTILLVAVILLFAMLIYNRVRDNFTRQKMQQAATARVKELLPQLQPQIRATLDEVVPYYAEMGRDRFQTMGPKLDARVQFEADRLGQELEKKINAQVEESFGRITNVAMVQLAKDFPAVTQDGGVRATEQLKQAMGRETAALIEHTRSLYQTQSQRIAGSLARFPVPDVSKTDTEALQRRLLHELLMFADYELTAESRPALQANGAAMRTAAK